MPPRRPTPGGPGRRFIMPPENPPPDPVMQQILDTLLLISDQLTGIQWYLALLVLVGSVIWGGITWHLIIMAKNQKHIW